MPSNQTCTGVLIGHKHLLTAAHCLYTDFKNAMDCKGNQLSVLHDERIRAWEAQGKVLKETTALREDLVQFRVSAPCPAQLICSRHPTRQTEPGDSGGPLMLEFEGQWYLVGIVKRQRAECQSKSCFTRVTTLCSWLTDASKGDVHCGCRIK
uniref:Peptidase S1 domain-containing protein n=1 Tax=Globodera rostochiensis TaxID=31243 RepID=A0A914HIH6_GLORO